MRSHEQRALTPADGRMSRCRDEPPDAGVRAATARGLAGAGRQGAEGRRLREAPRLAHRRRRSAIQPLYTRADAEARPPGAPVAQRPAGGRAAGTSASAMPSPIRAPPTRRSWRTSQGGVTSLLLQIEAPGQAGLPYGAEALRQALEGRVPRCLRRSRSTRARTPWMRPAA